MALVPLRGCGCWAAPWRAPGPGRGAPRSAPPASPTSAPARDSVPRRAPLVGSAPGPGVAVDRLGGRRPVAPIGQQHGLQYSDRDARPQTTFVRLAGESQLRAGRVLKYSACRMRLPFPGEQNSPDGVRPSPASRPRPRGLAGAEAAGEHGAVGPGPQLHRPVACHSEGRTRPPSTAGRSRSPPRPEG